VQTTCNCAQENKWTRKARSGSMVRQARVLAQQCAKLQCAEQMGQRARTWRDMEDELSCTRMPFSDALRAGMEPRAGALRTPLLLALQIHISYHADGRISRNWQNADESNLPRHCSQISKTIIVTSEDSMCTRCAWLTTKPVAECSSWWVGGYAPCTVGCWAIGKLRGGWLRSGISVSDWRFI
jgi:hypothetical protein